MTDEVFVTAAQLNEVNRRVPLDDCKPQYLSFRNPLLVTLFEKLLVRVPRVLRIEEMLPGSDQLLMCAGKKRVAELVLQWYTE